jgi:diguanylate cyclase (GGDEF)-like protein
MKAFVDPSQDNGGDGRLAPLTAGGPAWPVPEDEAARVAALHGLGVLDRAPAPDLVAVARLAAYVCGTPSAAVNLVDLDRQVTVASHGCDWSEVGRGSALCAGTVTGAEVVHTADASQDPRFRDNPFVAGPLGAVRAYASAPLLTPDGHAIGTLAAFDETPRVLTAEQLALLADLADQAMALLDLRRLSGALARAAASDVLTGLANQRTVGHALAKAIARAERGLGTPSVVVCDLDGFHAVNDTHGTEVGDAVLQAVADRLRDTARVIDTVARVAGDKFVVLLEHTAGPGAAAAVTRMRSALATTEGLGPVRASLGLSTYRPGDGVASMLARADAEMYLDKAARR